MSVMTPVRLALIIPTRNRALLAVRAVASVLDQRGISDRVAVFVSDNSTDDAAITDLASACDRFRARYPRFPLHYVRPDAPLSMGAHWNWIVTRVLEKDAADATHLCVLTDRMQFRRNVLRPLLDLCSLYPDDMVCYNHDRVNDLQTPIRVEHTPWSGCVIRIDPGLILHGCSLMGGYGFLPKLLSVIAPRAVTDRVKARFGDYCDALVPDFAFGLRAASVNAGILYHDRSALIHHGIALSNGAGMTRGAGAQSAAVRDFAGGNPETFRFTRAPIPELFTTYNAVAHEYNLVASGKTDVVMPELDKDRYVRANLQELSRMENADLREASIGLLRNYAPDTVAAWLACQSNAPTSPNPQAKPPVTGRLDALLRLLGDHDWLRPIWLPLVNRLGRKPSWMDYSFTNVEHALRHARNCSPPPNKILYHYNRLAARDPL